MSTSVYLAPHSVHNLRAAVASFNVNRIFLVTGKASFYASGVADAIEPLGADFLLTRFSDCAGTPTYEDMVRGAGLFRRADCELIIAVGGGSVIDMAKLIKSSAGRIDAAHELISQGAAITPIEAPLIAIPTTAGSGSEATHFAVVYLDGTKYSVAHPRLLPDVAIVDANLMMSVGPLQAAISGIDAFSQGVEAYWSVGSTEESREYSRQAIDLAFAHLELCVRHPTLRDREAMAEAAWYAGKAINIAKTTAAHGMSYPMTALYNVPHGQAVAITLGEVLTFNHSVTDVDNADARGAAFVRSGIEDIATILQCRDIGEARMRLDGWMCALGLATRLDRLGIRGQSDLERIVAGVDEARISNNPRRVTEADVRAMLQRVLR